MLEKAKQKKSIVRNFMKLEDFKRQQDYDDYASGTGGGAGAFHKDADDFDLLYGLENE